MRKVVIGVDFGSDSARAVAVDAENGQRLGTGECEYPRWAKGMYCTPSANIFRQHPQDYLDALRGSIRGAIAEAGEETGREVMAIAVDTTGSTPAPVNERGVPLALLPTFSENPDAMFYMWKDHSAIKEASEINKTFSQNDREDYTRYQGDYSAEWYWAKILYAKRHAPEVCEAAVSWVEHSDWIPGVLTGRTAPSEVVRNATGAGHKAFWHSDFGGLPAKEILETIDPYLAQIAETYTAPSNGGTVIGKITQKWADELEISSETIVGTGVFDAHAAAIGAGIRPRYLVKVIGTSTVDMMIECRDALRGKDITDICGQAENSIVPGYVGIESGQAAFGDMFSWFRRILMWSVHDFLSVTGEFKEEEKEELERKYYKKLIARIEQEAMHMEPDQNLVALDWLNGRRYPKNNEQVKGMLSGLTLGTTAPQIYAALSMAAVFGSKRIFDTFLTRGIQIDAVITVGGIAKKSPYIMQMMADSIKRPILVTDDDQCSATGAAICAAVAAGIYPDILSANDHMSMGFCKTYSPDEKNAGTYDLLYRKYLNLARHEESLLTEYQKL